MMRNKKNLKIYISKRHLLATFFALLLPLVVFFAFVEYTKIATRLLVGDALHSLERLVIAYLIATFLGWLFSILFYRGRAAAVALPIFDVLQSFPTFAALPLAVYFWGATDSTVILFLIITIIWPIFFSVVSSLKLVKQEWQEAVHFAGLSRFQYLVHFLWPISIPGLITGSIIGLGEGWEALVATEIIVGVKEGFGSFFQSFSTNSHVTAFGILAFLILIFSANKVIWLPLMEWSHKTMEE